MTVFVISSQRNENKEDKVGVGRKRKEEKKTLRGQFSHWAILITFYHWCKMIKLWNKCEAV